MSFLSFFCLFCKKTKVVKLSLFDLIRVSSLKSDFLKLLILFSLLFQLLNIFFLLILAKNKLNNLKEKISSALSLGCKREANNSLNELSLLEINSLNATSCYHHDVH